MDWAVSVIVPFYNAERGLARCIESLLGQHLRALEIILVDDASVDASPDIARNYAGRWPERIRYWRQERNMGPGAARNAGMALARGEFVGFVDADDTVEPEMFSHMCTAARNAGAAVAVCGMRIVYDGAECAILPEHIRNARDLLKSKDMLPPAWNKICSRAFLIRNAITFPETLMAEDLVFSLRVLMCSQKIACINMPLYNYIKNKSSLIFDMSKRIEVLKSLNELKTYTKNNRDYKKIYNKIFFIHAIYNPLCFIVIDSMLKGNNRWQTLCQTPRYFWNLLKFLLGRIA